MAPSLGASCLLCEELAGKAFFKCTKQGANCQGGLRSSEGPSSETLPRPSAVTFCNSSCAYPLRSPLGQSWDLGGAGGWWWWRCDNFTHPKGLSAVKENREMLGLWAVYSLVWITEIREDWKSSKNEGQEKRKLEGGSLPKSKELLNKRLSFNHPWWSSLSSPISIWPDLAFIHKHMFLMTVLFCNQIPILSL